uniref:Endonuclease/exonuclease/phosphatase domain-containing protein n=1 Tax=Ananas comosus var. bracteatus TaxID=296719 RepID=A0A6V7NSW5_ANACO|nr:unnamed protein product [Ananas comosus var. bracteatus]
MESGPSSSRSSFSRAFLPSRSPPPGLPPLSACVALVEVLGPADGNAKTALSTGLAARKLDVSFFRANVRCQDVHSIPEFIFLTVDDRRFRILVEIESWEDANPIFLSEDMDKRLGLETSEAQDWFIRLTGFSSIPGQGSLDGPSDFREGFRSAGRRIRPPLTMLQRKVDRQLFLIKNVYGPTGSISKVNFFQELRNIGRHPGSLWVALGDFNVLLSLNDKNGLPSNTSDILAFREVISDVGLINLPIMNKSYTWSNGRRSPTLERLDRALISQDWLLRFPRSTLKALLRPRSDHTPLVLSVFTFVPTPSIFRFESFWLRYPTASEIVTSAWNSDVSTVEPVNRFSA